MNGLQHKLPPSPPLSPLMTNHSARIDEWRHQVEREDHVDSAHEPIQSVTGSSAFVRPSPSSARGLSGCDGHSSTQYSNWNAYETTKYAPIAPADRRVAPGSQTVASTDLPRTAEPDSTFPGRTSQRNEVYEADEDVELSDLEPEDGPLNGSVTVAELRAHNRRLKRFRLTHSQTRYLMSEFARQPRPDAAHRERLSREIPGFSGRQVQVWFQNRRAKLKRLTNDDRERVLRSRALPANFDMTQALQSPFTTSKPAFHAPVQPVAQISEVSIWKRPSANTQQHAIFTSHHPQYLDRSGYSTPPEASANKINQPTPHMATPASLSSKALSPKYTTRPASEAHASHASPPSNTTFGSHAMQQHPNDQRVALANEMSSVMGPSNVRHPRLMHQPFHQGSSPSSFYPESLPQAWQMTPQRPSAVGPEYNPANMPRLHPHQQSWNAPAIPSAPQTSVVASGPWYGQQEPGMMISRGYESINFEPLYRHQHLPRHTYDLSTHDMQRNAWTQG